MASIWKINYVCKKIPLATSVTTVFKQYFKRNSYPYELRKNKNNIMIPRVKTEIARGSFYYSGAKLHNNLPNKIKTSLSMSALNFISSIKL